MANARDIRRRIKSVQNTQKITQAMKMVAAAKVKKAEQKVKASRPFSNELQKAFQRLLKSNPDFSSMSNSDIIKPIDNFVELLKIREEVKTVGLLIVTSDKGLAGAYNANIVRTAMHRIKDLQSQNIKVKVFIVGTKGVNALKKENLDVVETYMHLPVIPTAGSASIIAEDMAKAFVAKEIDKMELITTSFVSMISYKVQNWQILPVQLAESTDEKSEENTHTEEMIIEPDSEDIMKKMVPLYISNRIFQALTEASASELAARMSAMSAASKNAEDMIQQLTTVYNKARQASITQEITEVVGGANALA